MSKIRGFILFETMIGVFILSSFLFFVIQFVKHTKLSNSSTTNQEQMLNINNICNYLSNSSVNTLYNKKQFINILLTQLSEYQIDNISLEKDMNAKPNGHNGQLQKYYVLLKNSKISIKLVLFIKLID